MKKNIKNFAKIGALTGVLATSQVQANELWFNGYVGYNNNTNNPSLRIEGGWNNDIVSTYGHVDVDSNEGKISKFGGLDITLGKGPIKLEHEFRTTGDLNFHRTGFKIDGSLGKGNYTSVAYYPLTSEDATSSHLKVYSSQEITDSIQTAFLFRKEKGFEYFEPEVTYKLNDSTKVFIQSRGDTKKLDTIVVGIKSNF